MNLKENKSIALSLIEEFNPQNEYLTDDEDIRDRINHIYNACLMNIARMKRIEKSIELEKEDSDQEYYKEFDIPEDCYIIQDIIVQDENNSIKNNQADYYRVDKKIYVNTAIKGKHILRYYAYPKLIEEHMEDTDYEFDIDLDIQYLLPYAVASDILKSDRAVDYTAYENKYRMELNNLSPVKEETRVYVSTKKTMKI